MLFPCQLLCELKVSTHVHHLNLVCHGSLEGLRRSTLCFLEGLRSLGRGNWREISRDFVTTRTPTIRKIFAPTDSTPQEGEHLFVV
ncbi:transcription factor DIVARICATA [Trifolium repens]|nr:transcription factor DIVARICATA [Trifolium repens]